MVVTVSWRLCRAVAQGLVMVQIAGEIMIIVIIAVILLLHKRRKLRKRSISQKLFRTENNNRSTQYFSPFFLDERHWRAGSDFILISMTNGDSIKKKQTDIIQGSFCRTEWCYCDDDEALSDSFRNVRTIQIYLCIIIFMYNIFGETWRCVKSVRNFPSEREFPMKIHAPSR